MENHWDISNRISPMRGFHQPIGEKPLINVVRPLGGKSKDGKKLTGEDTYLWDGKKYVYNWEPLKMQINTVEKRATLYQLLIDNPPWAFQRGLTSGKQKSIETYGNAFPPNDDQAWNRYLREMLRELIKTYGREKVASWRYCIGREVGTEGHWNAGRERFFKHYRNSLKAIRAVLPEAQVGTHFLWASSKKSYGPDFVKWCKAKGVDYDFVGVSFYPFYDRIKRVDLDYVYGADFSPIKDIPEWNPKATLEIHEFALIKAMSKKGNSFEKAPKGHIESYTVMLAKMMYEHDLHDVYRWGIGAGIVAEEVLRAAEGKSYFRSQKRGKPKVAGTMIDGIFYRDEKKDRYHALAYSYHVKPTSKGREKVTLDFVVPNKMGTTASYRTAEVRGKELVWTDWKDTQTLGRKGGEGSSLKVRLKVKAFSFQKVEVRLW